MAYNSSSAPVYGPSGVMIDGTFYKRVEEEDSAFTCTSLFKDLGAFLCGSKTSAEQQKEIEQLKKKEQEKKKQDKETQELLVKCAAALFSGVNLASSPYPSASSCVFKPSAPTETKKEAETPSSARASAPTEEATKKEEEKPSCSASTCVTTPLETKKEVEKEEKNEKKEKKEKKSSSEGEEGEEGKELFQ